METKMFVNLNIVRQTYIKYHWEMESKPKTFKDLQQRMTSDNLRSLRKNRC